MESDRSTDVRRPRPGYLIFALIALSYLGLRTAAEGYNILTLASDPLSAGSLLFSEDLGQFELNARATSNALANHARELVPLGAAELLLGTLLFLVGLKALLTSRASTSLLVQALVANALVVGVAYVLQQGVRGETIELIVRGTSDRPDGMTAADQRLVLWWSARGALAVQLGMFALCALFVTRPNARAALAVTDPQPEEES